MLEANLYPKLWKSYTLKPLAKVKNPVNYNEYRPIALGYHLSKIAESFIIDHLKHYITIQDDQFAYRAASSTTHALIKLLHDWTSSLDKPSISHIDVLFIDMSKAFDRLNPVQLARKLRESKVDTNLILLVNSYLTSRTHQVSVNNTLSPSLSVSVGVPQGSRLGPLLWLLYIDDLSLPCSMIKYADDCSAYTPVCKNQSTDTDNELNAAARSISTWCEGNDMLLNTKKSVVMRVKPSGSKGQTLTDLSIALKDDILLEVNSAKVLGVILDSGLKFKEHVAAIISKTNSKIHVLKVLASHGVDSKSRLKFYKCCILPGILYAIEAWYGFITDCERKKLERLQNLALKMILGFSDTGYEQRLLTANLVPIEQFYAQRRSASFNNVLSTESGPLYDILRGFININRRSHRDHFRSQYVFKTRTELYNKSFFISTFKQ